MRLLSPSIPVDTLHVFDSNLIGKIRFGPGKKTDDFVINWKASDDAVSWPVRLNEKVSYEIVINYDAPKANKSNKIVEGDAGKATSRAGRGAGGDFVVKIGSHEISRKVKQGNQVEDNLGKIMLGPGNHEIRVEALEITGEELMNLRKISLKPITINEKP